MALEPEGKEDEAIDISKVYRPQVFSIPPTDSLVEAARQMRANDASSLMVLDGEKFVGIITERDLTRAIAAGDPPEATNVADYMTDHPITVGPETGIRETAAEMLELEARHLPVGLGGQVVGMISLRDLLGVVVQDATL